ncbi:MAG: hypothetical protein ACE5HQ_06070 [Gemmatimonadota bacterium]
MSGRITTAIGAIGLLVGLAACGDSVAPLATDTSATSAAGAKGSRNDTRLEARLTSTSSRFPDAKGRARFRDRSGEQQLQIEIENVAPGATVSFVVDGSSVGSAMADAIGAARLDLNSDLGDAVPAVSEGTTVQARIGGATVAAGSF